MGTALAKSHHLVLAALPPVAVVGVLLAVAISNAFA